MASGFIPNSRFQAGLIGIGQYLDTFFTSTGVTATLVDSTGALLKPLTNGIAASNGNQQVAFYTKTPGNTASTLVDTTGVALPNITNVAPVTGAGNVSYDAGNYLVEADQGGAPLAPVFCSGDLGVGNPVAVYAHGDTGEIDATALSLANLSGAVLTTPAGETLYLNAAQTLNTSVASTLCTFNGIVARTLGGNTTGMNVSVTDTGSGAVAVGNYTGMQIQQSRDAAGSVTNWHTVNALPSTTANFSSGTIAQLNGVRVSPSHVGAGAVTTLRGFFVQPGTITGGTVGNLVGLEVGVSWGSASATIASGIKINGVAAAASNYAVWMNSNTAGTGAGFVFGTAADASFWRGAAAQLLTTGDWSTRHYLCSSTPTVAAGAAAGSSPTIGIAGTDHGCAVTLTTGSAPTTGTLFTITWGASWTSSAPSAVFCAGNAAAAALSGTTSPLISGVSQTTLTFTNGTAGLVGATVYIWRFVAMR